jgi:hypothetical protein
MKKVGTSESALRRRADREGYKLVKSRQTGLFGLASLEYRGMVFGWEFDATLEDNRRVSVLIFRRKASIQPSATAGSRQAINITRRIALRPLNVTGGTSWELRATPC